jgi:hypothetical protein
MAVAGKNQAVFSKSLAALFIICAWGLSVELASLMEKYANIHINYGVFLPYCAAVQF